MKPFFALTAAAAVMSIVACGPSQAEIDAAKQKATEDSIAAAAAAEHTYNVDVATSKVNWSGTMVGVKTHTGSLSFANGTITTKGPTITGGEFTVDMKSYALTDTNYAADGAKQGTRANLMQHLMAPDFFNVDSFPTASFKITAVNGNTATGDLTVRGKTNPESVTDIVVTPNADGTVSATGKLVFNRQKYGVSWKAPKDMVVKDDIELNIELNGKAQ
ncbi:MAG: YceI family protein [Flavobacteriales bacterium]